MTDTSADLYIYGVLGIFLFAFLLVWFSADLGFTWIVEARSMYLKLIGYLVVLFLGVSVLSKKGI